MKLNTNSYVHKLIRDLCLKLELKTDMKLITDLSEEFTQIRFVKTLGYITIDYRRKAFYTLGHKVDKAELQMIEEIIIYLRFLDVGNRYADEKRRSFYGNN